MRSVHDTRGLLKLSAIAHVQIQVQRANEHSGAPAPEKGVPHEYRAAAELALRTKGTPLGVEAEMKDMVKRNNSAATRLPTRTELVHFKKGLSRLVRVLFACFTSCVRPLNSGV